MQSYEVSKKWEGYQKDIRVLLETHRNQQITFKEYCQLAEKSTQAPIQYLAQMEATSQGNKKTPEKGNHINLYMFLTSPNILYLTKETNPSKKKQKQQAGKKLISMISTGWNYYVRMIKGYLSVKKQSEKSNLYNLKNIELGKGRIRDMLTELKDCKYHWENYTSEGLSDWEAEKKEIEEEETFVKLLNNMLKQQITKVIKARQSEGQPATQREQRQTTPVIRMRQEEAEEEEEVVVEECKKKKKNLSELINVRGYFQQRKKQLSQQLYASSVVNSTLQFYASARPVRPDTALSF